jgi:DNA-binding transcriptional MocR family regulator
MKRARGSGAAQFAYLGVYRYLLDVLAAVEPGQRIKLPSLRALGRQLGVSVSTAQAAYTLLETEGRIQSVAKSGYFADGPAPFPPALYGSDLLQRMLASACQPTIQAFSRGAPPADTVAVGQLLKLEAQLARRYPAGLAELAQPGGELELRRVLAARYTRSLHDSWSADDVYIGSDFSAVLEMTWTALELKGAVVAVPAPCSWRILRTLQAAGAQVVELALAPGEKFPLQRLQALFTRHRVRVIVLGSSFLWPLGMALSDADKRGIARLLERQGVWVVEDDTQGDLAVRPGMRFRELVDPQRLLVLGSLQYSLGAEAPFAYLLSRHWHAGLQRLCLQRAAVPPPLRHKALARFIGSGGYDAHITRLIARVQPQVAARARVLRTVLDEHLHINVPAGGATLWAAARHPVDMRSVFETLRQQRFLIAPGDIFSLQGHCQHHLRVDASRHDTNTFERLLVALGCALERHRL